MCDALDFGDGVIHVIVPGAILIAPFAAEVHVAGQLAAHEQVHAARHAVGFQRARVGERRMHLRGAQVDEHAERLADAEQTHFGADRGVERVPLRAADRAHEHAVGCQARVDGRLRQRFAHRIDGRSADELLVVGERVAELRTDGVQALARLVDDLGPNAVALQQHDLVFHARLRSAAFSARIHYGRSGQKVTVPFCPHNHLG